MVKSEMNIQQFNQAVNSRSGRGCVAVPSGGVNDDASRGFFYGNTVAACGFFSSPAGGQSVAPGGVTRLLSGAPSGANSRLRGHCLFVCAFFYRCKNRSMLRNELRRSSGRWSTAVSLSTGRCVVCAIVPSLWFFSSLKLCDSLWVCVSVVLGPVFCWSFSVLGYEVPVSSAEGVCASLMFKYRPGVRSSVVVSGYRSFSFGGFCQ